MKCPFHKDPFKQAREKNTVQNYSFQDEVIPMILRHKAVREAARDWKTYSSDAPFRVPIPSEEDVRTVRQLPIETDPPAHKEYRNIVDPFFRRPKDPEMIDQVEQLIESHIRDALNRQMIEIVREFALPVQSIALTYLLDVDVSEANEWISWGTHVFKEGDGVNKGAKLETYIRNQLQRTKEHPGDDFFSALNKAVYQNRALSMDEKIGFANLVFAGGRDTIIHTISAIIGFFGMHPEALHWLRDHADSINLASEEFVRALSPLTHIGRVCPMDTDLFGEPVASGQRISLGWAAANYDPSVFDDPESIQLDRKPNPHVGYGTGIHNCIGAAHARLIIRSLLSSLCSKVDSITIIDHRDNVESTEQYRRVIGYETLTVRMNQLHKQGSDLHK